MFAFLPLLPLFSLALSISPSVALSSHRSLHSNIALQHKRHASSVGNRSLLVGDDPAELTKRDGTKYVFMHHIVGNTYPYTQADWADDIRQIQAKGVDAIALNYGFDSWQPAQMASAYAAALGTNMKLFLSPDFTEIACDINAIANQINQFANHPNQFKVNGKTFISSFSGDCLGNGGWAQLKSMTNGYAMPFIWGLEGQFNNWPALDSWYCWGCAWPEGNYDKNTNDDQYYIGQLGSRYATTVSGWMFAHGSNKNWYQRGDDWLINSRWEQLIAMRDQLTYVEMVTWNDYGESDYFGPMKGAPPADVYWANNYPHSPFFDMSGYYIQAFKTGSYPAITTDVIYYWSRPHLAGATASADQFGKPTGSDWALDFVWAAVFATSPASVTLQVGGNSQTFNVPAGVTKLKLPMTTGQITVTMVRGGQTVISKTDTNLNIISNPTQYNYNAYVGSATGTGGSGTPPATTPTTAASTPTTTTTNAPPATTTVVSGVTWTAQGCYVDDVSSRTLTGSMVTSNAMTISNCLTSCAAGGFAFAGVEYGIQCFCGSSLKSGVATAPGTCNMNCAGLSTEKCGDGNRINIYSRNPGSVITKTAPSSWTSQGCYVDGAVRMLQGSSTSQNGMTVNTCTNICSGQGYTMAAVEYGKECYCGSQLVKTNGAGVPAGSTDCNMPCGGNSGQTCGGGWRANLYTSPGTTLSRRKLRLLS